MAQVLDVATQEVVEVPDEQVTQLVASGKALLPNGEVRVTNASGEAGTAPAESVAQLFSQGWKFRSEAEDKQAALQAEYGDRPVAAGAAGLARGITLGLSDPLLTATGLATPEGLRNLEDLNPEASIGSEVVGSAAPIFFSAGAATPAALAARGAAKVGTTVAGGAGGRALVRLGVEGAVEGGLQGLGRAVTDAAQERDPLTAQKALASTAEGALFGFGAGALFGGGADFVTRRGASAADDVADEVVDVLDEMPGAPPVSAAMPTSTPTTLPEGVLAGGPTGRLQSVGGPPPTAPVPRKAGTYEIPISELDDISSTPEGKRGAADAIRALYDKGLKPKDIDPIKIGTDGGDESGLKRTLVDGNHRLAVARERGESTIRVTFTDDESAARFFGRPRADDNYKGATAPVDARPLQSSGGGGGAPPPAGATAPGAPPPPPGGGGAARAIANGALAAAKPLKEAVEKNPGVFKRVFEALDLSFPDANEWVLRGLDIKKKAATLLDQKDLLEAAPEALRKDARFAKVKNGKDAAELIAKKMDEEGSVVRERAAHLDDLVQPRYQLDVDAFAARAREELVAPLQRGTVDQRRTGARLQRELNALLEAVAVKTDVPDGAGGGARRMGFAQGEDYKRALDQSLKWDSTVPNAHRDALRQLRGMFNAAQEEAAERASKFVESDAFAQWKTAKQEFGKMASLNDIAQERLQAAKTANRLFSITDNIAGAAAGAVGGGLNPVGLAAGLGAALLNKWGRENLPFVMARAMADYESNPGVKQAARVLVKRLQGGVASGPPGEQAMAQAVQQAAQQGPREAWLMHTLLSGAVEYRAMAEREGLADYQAPVDEEGERRAGAVARVEAAAEDFDKRADAAAKGLLSGKRSLVKTLPRAEAMARAERVVENARNPDAFTTRVAERVARVGEQAPGLASDMQDTAQRAQQFLSTKAPRRPVGPLGDVPALRGPWKPTEVQLAKWSAYVRAVESPASVLEDAAGGGLTAEAVEALGAVYPELLADMRSRVLAEVSAHPSALDYRQRLALGQLLGLPLDPSQSPAFIAAAQAAHQSQPARPQGNANTTSPRAAKRIASEFSPTEALEQRGA